jgi:hypothetical protein
MATCNTKLVLNEMEVFRSDLATFAEEINESIVGQKQYIVKLMMDDAEENRRRRKTPAKDADKIAAEMTLKMEKDAARFKVVNELGRLYENATGMRKRMKHSMKMLAGYKAQEDANDSELEKVEEADEMEEDVAISVFDKIKKKLEKQGKSSGSKAKGGKEEGGKAEGGKAEGGKAEGSTAKRGQVVNAKATVGKEEGGKVQRRKADGRKADDGISDEEQLHPKKKQKSKDNADNNVQQLRNEAQSKTALKENVHGSVTSDEDKVKDKLPVDSDSELNTHDDLPGSGGQGSEEDSM